MNLRSIIISAVCLSLPALAQTAISLESFTSNREAPTVVSVSPGTSASAVQTFAVTARDPLGFANINRIYFLVNTAPSVPVGSCHGFYDRASNGIFLYNDAVTAVTGPVTPGVAGTIQNSQCAVNGADSSVTGSGTDIVLNLNLTRQGAYAFDAKTLYIWVKDNANNDTGWIAGSTWTLTSSGQFPPTVAAVAPAQSNNPDQTFTITARDPNGNADISRIYFLANSAPSVPSNSCHGFYDRATNGIYLYNDALTAITGPLTPGVAGFIQNSQCFIDGAASSVTASGTDVVLNLRFGLLGAYTFGGRTLYIWVKDSASNDTGWIAGSNWTLSPGTQVPPTVVSVTPQLSSAVTQTFAATTSDANWHTDINKIYFLVNDSPSVPAGSCHGYYDRASDSIYLYNDALTALIGPVTPGAAATIQNSQCAINAAASSVARGGPVLALNLNITRQGSYASGNKTLYIWAKDNSNNDTGWIAGSAWSLSPFTQSPPSVVGVTPTSATSATQTFSAIARDSNGYTDISRIYFLVNTVPSIPAGSCHGLYDRASNGIFLYNDGLTDLLGPLTPGVAGTIQNSQCAINGSASFVTASGTDVVLNLNITRQGAYAFDAKTIYIWVKDSANNDTGWISGSTWTLPPTAQFPPAVVGVTPSSATTASQTFAATARDSNGFADITRIYFLVNDTPSVPAGSCHGFYDRATNGIYLYNDALTAFTGPVTPGVAGTIQNSQCAINGTGSLVTASGTDIVLYLNITRQGSYTTGARTLYIWVKDNANNDTGWIVGSTWSL